MRRTAKRHALASILVLLLATLFLAAPCVHAATEDSHGIDEALLNDAAAHGEQGLNKLLHWAIGARQLLAQALHHVSVSCTDIRANPPPHNFISSICSSAALPLACVEEPLVHMTELKPDRENAEHSDPEELKRQAQQAGAEQNVKSLQERKKEFDEIMAHARQMPTEAQIMNMSLSIAANSSEDSVTRVNALRLVQELVEDIDLANGKLAHPCICTSCLCLVPASTCRSERPWYAEGLLEMISNS
jgi:hypothetical protein